jgi:threonine dehydratase
MIAALEEGKPVTLEPATTIADGIAVKRAGDLTLEHVKRYVDDVVTVSEEEIASAILHLLEKEKTVVEGAGAVGVAALLDRKVRLDGRRVVALVSGGNIDVNLVARIIERGLVKDGRLVRISVALMDKPGQLARVSSIIANHRANVIEVHHTRAFATRFGDTTLQLTLETRGPDHVEEILRALRERGYQVQQLGI